MIKEKKKSKKKTKPKKKKRKKGEIMPNFEDIYTNQQVLDEFYTFLKKCANENDLRYFISAKRFEDEENDLQSKAMNICFEFLGIGGGELIVSLDGATVNELSQVIRSKQPSKTMFHRSLQQIEANLRTQFSNYY